MNDEPNKPQQPHADLPEVTAEEIARSKALLEMFRKAPGKTVVKMTGPTRQKIEEN